jgi:hypothetical protein
MSWIRPVVLAVGLPIVLVACGTTERTESIADRSFSQISDSTFGSLVDRLSEPSGYFDTDNLISNEDSYLHVMGGLRRIGVEGGAFVGVGPDQGFSYIAQIRPSLAFMIDVRRDNLLQHLWFKALFTLAETRLEYLSLMFGKVRPDDLDRWTAATAREMVAALDSGELDSGEVDGDEASAIRSLVRETIVSFGVDLTEEDLRTVDFIHRSFIRGGVGLKFTSFGRAPNPYYPSYRDLLLATDLAGRQGNYLAREEDYQFLRELQLANRVIPVVGDLAGDHAVNAIGEEVRRRGLTVSAFYTSNVEFYLFEDGSWGRFAENLATLPRNSDSVIIRSFFRRRHPQAQPGFLSTQVLQRIDRLVEEWESGRLRTYFQVVTVGIEPTGF